MVRKLYPYNPTLNALNLDPALTPEAARTNTAMIQRALIAENRESLLQNKGVNVPILLLIEQDNEPLKWCVVHLNKARTVVYFTRAKDVQQPFDATTAIFTCLPQECAGDIEWTEQERNTTPTGTGTSNADDNVDDESVGGNTVMDDIDAAMATANDDNQSFEENGARIQAIANEGKDNDDERPLGEANINPMVLAMLNIHHHGIVPCFILSEYYKNNDIDDDDVPSSVARNYEGNPTNDIAFSFFGGHYTRGFTTGYVPPILHIPTGADDDGNSVLNSDGTYDHIHADHLHNGLIIQCTDDGTSLLLLMLELQLFPRSVQRPEYTHAQTPEDRWQGSGGDGLNIYEGYS
jgi:hypothetical protein